MFNPNTSAIIKTFLYISSILSVIFTLPAPARTAGDPVSITDNDKTVIIENAALGVRLNVKLENGIYRVSRNGRLWLGDGLIAIRRKGKMILNAASGGAPSRDMKLTAHTTGDGSNSSGDYKSVTLDWDASGFKFKTQFRVFANVPQVEFVHIFPDGYKAESAAKFEDTSLNFPVFVAGPEGDSDHLFSYLYPIWPAPVFGEGARKTLAAWGDKANRTPLVVMDTGGGAGVLSPFSDYLIRIVRVLDLSAQGFGPAAAVGLEGELEYLKPGHSSSSILHFNDAGASAAIMSYGAELLKAAGKKPVGKNDTLFLKYIGYWTDNGAYYYYRTEPGKNYETTLLDMNEYLKKESIPLRYIQLDSWWYPKSNIDKGVLLWEPIKEMFPDGLETFQKKLGLPLTFHNRYFAKDTGYRDKLPFVDGRDGTHPLGPEIFGAWGDSVKKWGGVMYEQDWLGTQFGKVEKLRSDPDFAAAWLKNMADAMAARGLEIQYCMPTIGFYLESTLFQNVTNIRSSNDYQIRFSGGTNQLWWEHVYTSPLIYALGALPFKDVIITNPPEKKVSNPVVGQFAGSTGGKYDENATLFEPYFHQSALLSILSAGPVGIGDRAGYVNKPVVMLMADEDGALVKPDRPLIPTEKMYYSDPLTQPVALTGYTLSTVSGNTWYYVLALNANKGLLKSTFQLSATDLGLKGKYVPYDFITGKTQEAGDGFSIERKLRPSDFMYLVLAPISERGRALIGDTGKYVTASAERIKSWSDGPDGMEVELNGPADSATVLTVYSGAAPTAATVQPGGTAIEKTALTQAGNNIYKISLRGGAGKNIRIEF